MSLVVLESKDKLLKSLQPPEAEATATAQKKMPDPMVANLELQLSDLRDQNDELRGELQAVESRFQKIRENLTEKWEIASRELNTQTSQKKAAESEARALRTEIRTAKDESQKLQTQLDSAKRDIRDLQLKLSKSAKLSDSQTDLDLRLQKMTEALLAKQEALDRANSGEKRMFLVVFFLLSSLSTGFRARNSSIATRLDASKQPTIGCAFIYFIFVGVFFQCLFVVFGPFARHGAALHAT